MIPIVTMLLKQHNPSTDSPNILSIPIAPNTLNNLKTPNAPNTSNTRNDRSIYKIFRIFFSYPFLYLEK